MDQKQIIVRPGYSDNKLDKNKREIKKKLLF